MLSDGPCSTAHGCHTLWGGGIVPDFERPWPVFEMQGPTWWFCVWILSPRLTTLDTLWSGLAVDILPCRVSLLFGHVIPYVDIGLSAETDVASRCLRRNQHTWSEPEATRDRSGTRTQRSISLCRVSLRLIASGLVSFLSACLEDVSFLSALMQVGPV